MTLQMQADDFFNAYLVLKDNNEVMIERLSNSSEKSLIEKKDLGTRPTAGIDIVCLAFSIELYIKDLHFAIKGEAPLGHDILKLYEELPEQIQQKIFGHDAISHNPFNTRGDVFSHKRFTSDYSAYDGFIDQIKAISDGFIKWRYSYEYTALRYDVSFALAFMESIKSAAEEVRKDNV